MYKRAYQLARQAADTTHLRNKRAYDQKVKFQKIQEGDRVLLKNLVLKGNISWKADGGSLPHVVVGQMPNLPVFRVNLRKEEVGKEPYIEIISYQLDTRLRIPVEQGLEETNDETQNTFKQNKTKTKNCESREKKYKR